MKKALLLFAVIAASLTSNSQSWTIVSKYYMLNDVFAIDKDTVVAVGNNGLIIRSTDGGARWTYITSPSAQNLLGVYFPYDTLGYAIGVNGTLLRTNNAGRTWVTQTSGTTSTLDDIYFLNPTTGFMVGANDRFMKTTNGGASWTISTVISSLNWLKAVHFVNATTGWVGGLYGEIYYTSNGGTSWVNKSLGATDKNTIHFFSTTRGLVSGVGQNLISTVNTGTNWTVVTPNHAFRKMCFVDTLRGWGVNGTTIKRTTDGGANWVSQTNPTTRNLYAVQFIDSLTGWAVGDAVVLRTIDGGITWTRQTSVVTDCVYEDVHFVSPLKGHAVGNGAGAFSSGHIHTTIDGGATWTDYSPNNALESIHFINKDTGWVAGDNFNNSGRLYRTVDGGANWTQLNTTVFDDIWFKDFNNGFRLTPYLSSFDRTTNGGTTWTAIQGFSGQTGEINFPTVNNGFATTNGSAAFKTINGGTTWTNGGGAGFGAHYANPTKGWRVTAGGGIYRTQDGGITWGQLTSGTTQALRDVYFTDDVHGFIAGDAGVLLQTNNGYDWTPSSVVPTALHAVHSAGTGEVYVTGANGVVLKKDLTSVPVCNNITANFILPTQAFVWDTMWLPNTSTGASTYSWTDNSAGFSTSTTPALVITTAGTHTVCLTATNGNCSDKWCQPITIYNCGTNWVSKAPYPPTGNKPYSAIAFAIGNKGYVGTGWDGTFRKDFWEYDTRTNVWTQRADVPSGRYDASGFAIGNKGYVFGGYTTGYVLSKELMEYDPVGNAWVQKTPITGAARASASAFVIGQKAYIAGGAAPGMTTELWEYNSTNDTWTQKTNMGGLGRQWAAAFAIGTKGYVCTGATTSFTYTADVWEYDSQTDTWTQLANYPGNPRRGAVGFSDGVYGYVGCGKYGSTSYASDFFRFNPGNGSWGPISGIGGAGGRENASSFFCNGSGYVVNGNTWTSGPVGELWQYKSCALTTSAPELLSERAVISVYPNPMNEQVTFTVQSGNYSELQLEVFDLTGRRVFEVLAASNEFTMKKDGLAEGIYIWKVISCGKLIGTGKLAVN